MLCIKYSQVYIRLVGTSSKRKAKQDDNTKRLKKIAKYTHEGAAEDLDQLICSSCGRRGHRTARSKECPNYKPTKVEELQALLGDNVTTFTRKVRFEKIIREEYRNQILTKVKRVSDQLRNIMIRAQLFVNYYIITHSNTVVDKKVFSQNFWYAVTQLVLKIEPNAKHLPSDLLDSWRSFSSRFQVTYEMQPKVEGYSQCISAACVTMATAYCNNIVEVFESRLKAYILYNIMKNFEQVCNISPYVNASSNFLMYEIQPNKGILQKIVHEYCYQKICGGSASWPEDLPQAYNDKRPQIDDFCLTLSNMNIPRPVTLQTLSASPGAYIPMLATILQKNEEENTRITSNRLNEVPPRLFSLTPVPSMKWRFIDINPNVLSAFARKSKASSYAGKLEMFQQVFDLDRVKVDRSAFVEKYKTFVAITNIIYVSNIALKISRTRQGLKRWHSPT